MDIDALKEDIRSHLLTPPPAIERSVFDSALVAGEREIGAMRSYRDQLNLALKAWDEGAGDSARARVEQAIEGTPEGNRLSLVESLIAENDQMCRQHSRMIADTEALKAPRPTKGHPLAVQLKELRDVRKAVIRTLVAQRDRMDAFGNFLRALSFDLDPESQQPDGEPIGTTAELDAYFARIASGGR